MTSINTRNKDAEKKYWGRWRVVQNPYMCSRFFWNWKLRWELLRGSIFAKIWDCIETFVEDLVEMSRSWSPRLSLLLILAVEAFYVMEHNQAESDVASEHSTSSALNVVHYQTQNALKSSREETDKNQLVKKTLNQMLNTSLEFGTDWSFQRPSPECWVEKTK